MNMLLLSYKNLLDKPLSSLLSWLLLTFGVTIVVMILLVSSQLETEISKNTGGIDLVIGAKGSPLQIILANIFQVDFPTGNISLKEAAAVSHNRYIDSAIPLALGDSYRGVRIVGTTPAYAGLYGGSLVGGNWYSSPMEVVVGAQAARELELHLGDTFESQHGLAEDAEEHAGHAFRVTGLLSETHTVIDRLILTDIHSVWEVHGHEEGAEHQAVADSLVDIAHLGLQVTPEELEEEQVTSLLVKYRSPMGAVVLPRAINAESNLQAASPAFETARLFNIIGVGVKVLNLLALLIIVISGVSVFIALLNSLKDRKYDIAIMRSMGATKGLIFLLVLTEGMLITFAGGVSGLLIAHLGVIALSRTLEGVSPQGFYFIPAEGWVIAGCFLIGLLASLIPALLAYRTDISKTLAKG